MNSLLFVLMLGALANALDCPPPPDCGPPTCGGDEIWCRDHIPPPTGPQCPTCPNECLVHPPCPTGTCIKTEVDGPHGNKCYNACPAPPCQDGLTQCAQDYDSNGCPMPQSCVPMANCPGERSSCVRTHDSVGCPVDPE